MVVNELIDAFKKDATIKKRYEIQVIVRKTDYCELAFILKSVNETAFIGCFGFDVVTDVPYLARLYSGFEPISMNTYDLIEPIIESF